MPRLRTLAIAALATCASLLIALCVPAQESAAPQNSAAATPVAPKFDSIKIDSLDVDAWNGIVFVAHAFGQPSHFALRFGTASHGQFIDGASIYEAVREVGAHAPDASYSRIAWQVAPRASLVTLEWSRIDDSTVVGRMTGKPDFQNVLETYIPFSGVSWGAPAVFSIAENKQAIIRRPAFRTQFFYGGAIRRDDRPANRGKRDLSWSHGVGLDDEGRGHPRLIDRQ